MGQSSRAENATILFLRRWLSAPAGIGAVAPSSRALGRAMARTALADRPWERGIVLELGPGTGRITDALLAEGMPAGDLVAVERDRDMAAFLRARQPRIEIIEGDAAELSRLVDGRPVGAIVSSLPLLSLPAGLVDRIVASAADLLRPGASLVQFTYGRQSPVPQSLAKRCGFAGQPVTRIWRNIPPATVWRFVKSPA